MRNGEGHFETTSVYMDFSGQSKFCSNMLEASQQSCVYVTCITDLRNWEIGVLTQVSGYPNPVQLLSSFYKLK